MGPLGVVEFDPVAPTIEKSTETDMKGEVSAYLAVLSLCLVSLAGTGYPRRSALHTDDGRLLGSSAQAPASPLPRVSGRRLWLQPALAPGQRNGERGVQKSRPGADI